MLEDGCTSEAYAIIRRAIETLKNVFGISCEIGLRRGGGTRSIIDSFIANNDKRLHIAIDPYGNILYRINDNFSGTLDYNNDMKYETLSGLYQHCKEVKADFLFFPLEDTEFFKRYADGVPVYYEQKSLVNEYALVFFDGPHGTSNVLVEIDFFADRTPVGGVWVFDNFDYYDHMYSCHNRILDLGFEEIERLEPEAIVAYKRRRK